MGSWPKHLVTIRQDRIKLQTEQIRLGLNHSQKPVRKHAKIILSFFRKSESITERPVNSQEFMSTVRPTFQTAGAQCPLSCCSLWWWLWPAVWQPWRCHRHTGWPAVWPAAHLWASPSPGEPFCTPTGAGRHWTWVGGGKSSLCQTWVSEMKSVAVRWDCRVGSRQHGVSPLPERPELLH